MVNPECPYCGEEMKRNNARDLTQRIMRGIVLWGISILIALLMAIITMVVACGIDSYDTISFTEETKEEK